MIRRVRATTARVRFALITGALLLAAACSSSTSDGPAGPSPTPTPFDSSKNRGPVTPTTLAFTLDTTWLLPGRTIEVRIGRVGEPIPTGVQFTVDDTTVAQLPEASTFGFTRLVLRRDGRVRLRARFGTVTIDSTLTVLPLPPVFPQRLLDTVAFAGTPLPDNETIAWAARAVMRVPVSVGPLTPIALFVQGESVQPTVRCGGDSRSLTAGSVAAIVPRVFESYLYVRAGAPVTVRLLVRDATGQLWIADGTTPAGSLTARPTGGDLPEWVCQ
jgi:hypothetical protein